MPDGKNKGNLETLCLSTVKTEGVMKCIDSFMDCMKQELKLKSNDYQEPKSIYKARCRA